MKTIIIALDALCWIAILSLPQEIEHVGELVKIDRKDLQAWHLVEQRGDVLTTYTLAMPSKAAGAVCEVEERAKRLVGMVVWVQGRDGGSAFLVPTFFVKDLRLMGAK